LHEPVLVRQVLERLHIDKGDRIIDATVGTGGHAMVIAAAGARVLGIDADKEMLAVAAKRLPRSCTLVHGNFRNIDEIAVKAGWNAADGIVFDLGVSNPQLTSAARGFSYTHPEASLDMRVDPIQQGLTGADLLNALREDQLVVLFEKVLDWSAARKIAKEVVRFRTAGKIKTVGDFLEICRFLRGKPGLPPATRPFLALRMAVNGELENLEEALPKALGLLGKGGRLAVITFHSGEERRVVTFFRQVQRERAGRMITKAPLTPTEAEIASNARARSAKLFILEKL
jgi:16S rRNA (cytosine1402-N4)-methyltransferase